jgi:Amt family ammonium transporter
LIAAAIAIVIAMVASFILLKLTDLLVGVRVEGEDETLGLDLSQHGEEGYNLDADLGTSVIGSASSSSHGTFAAAHSSELAS